MRIHTLRTAALTTLLYAVNAPAHHNATAAFTQDIINVEGYVTEFSFTNPHVNLLLEVTGENGETTQWLAEGVNFATTARRDGWASDTIQKGQYLLVTGRETRDGSPMILWGDIVELNPTDGTIVRNVVGESEYEEPIGIVQLAETLSDGRPNLSGGGLDKRPASNGGERVFVE